MFKIDERKTNHIEKGMEDFVRRLRSATIVLATAVFAIALMSPAFAGGSCPSMKSKAGSECTKTAAAKAGCCAKSGDKSKSDASCTAAEKKACASKMAGTSANESQLTFGVAYMTCDGCANQVSKAIKGVDGVQSVSVDYRTGTADVTFDLDVVSSAKLIKAIEEAGYHAQVGPYSDSELAEFANANKSGK